MRSRILKARAERMGKAGNQADALQLQQQTDGVSSFKASNMQLISLPRAEQKKCLVFSVTQW